MNRLLLPLAAVVLAAFPIRAENLRSNDEVPLRVAQQKGEAAQNRTLPSTAPQEDLSKSRAWVGIVVKELSLQQIRRRGLKSDHQVYIESLTPNGPAANGGLRPNDVILRVNNVNTLRTFDVAAQLNIARNGETVVVTVFRDRQELNFNVNVIRLELAPSDVKPNRPPAQQR